MQDASVGKAPTPSPRNARGAVFTRLPVVELVLDLVGYTIHQPLHTRRLLEPACGQGHFLLPALDRLLASWPGHRPTELTDCLRAVELHPDSYAHTQERVLLRLRAHGLSAPEARDLASHWLRCDDFLLTPLRGRFHAVVGNPPYVRQERIPGALRAAYRARYPTLFHRADLYVPFIERSLRLLAPGGQLGFLCSDRWMKNRYGGPLRALVARSFRLKIVVDMAHTQAFHGAVGAYPAITILSREAAGPTRTAVRPVLHESSLHPLCHQLLAPESAADGPLVQTLPRLGRGSDPWLLAPTAQHALVRHLEDHFPTLEEVGCKVGIGVATGADACFVGLYQDLDVEASRKLPLAMTGDLVHGSVQWRGFAVINPFTDSGRLVNLADYPRLQSYLQARRAVIAARHIARRHPNRWYRTIDRIYPQLACSPKLLIPDIKGHAHVVYEPGQLYPHHNLYCMTSQHWPLRALQAVLCAGLAQLFVAAYGPRLRGDALRFQAQYLRRICLPAWHSVPPEIQAALQHAAVQADGAALARAAVRSLYALDAQQMDLLHTAWPTAPPPTATF